MNKDLLFNELTAALKKGRVLADEPMNKHTTFRTGGAAVIFAEPYDADELRRVLELLDGKVFCLIGNGSNLLVSDAGIDGVVIKLGKGFCYAEADADNAFISCGAGATLAQIARSALDASLTGCEFAAGIPGSLGGAIFMNAGAYGGEMKQIVSSVTLMDYNGRILKKSADEMRFSYRSSILKEEPYIVLGAGLELWHGKKEQIREKMDELAAKRREKQPLEYPSAGSAFKRPEGYFAAKLIEDAGLRGFCVGGAQVSEKHCGFVINKGNATSADIYALISEVRGRVRDSAGVDIEPEVIMLGDFDREEAYLQ